MEGRSRFGLLTLVLATLLATPLAASAQQEVGGRFRVLVPDFWPQGEADDDFGEDVADKVRELLEDLATHQPIDEREVRTALRRFKIDKDELNCIKARQLAGQIDGQLVLCGNYEEIGDEVYRISARFVNVADGESFEVETIERTKDQDEETASHVIQEFGLFVEQLRAAQFCGDYYQSQQWENALTNCNRAIELNPTAISPRYVKARVLMEQENWQGSLEELQTVLEQNPIHEGALQTAGYVSAKMGSEEQAQSYYREYLELQPGNVSVRMNIAYELAQAGDPAGAMELIQEGIELDPENPDLYEQLGNFAFAAAVQEVGKIGGANTGVDGSENGGELPAEVQELYRTAIDAYTRVFESKGEEMEVSQLRNIVAAHIQLDELDEATAFAERVLETHGDAAVIWSIYADALQKQGNLDEAIAALEEIKSIDPDYANVAVRQGNWLLEDGRVDEAVPMLRQAVERGEQPADVVANILLAHAHSQGVNQQNFGYAMEVLDHAYEFEPSEAVKPGIDFWYGYSLFQRAIELEEPQTLETANRTLPMFRRARELFQAGSSYAEKNNIDLSRFMENTGVYIEIEEAIIQRGNR